MKTPRKGSKVEGGRLRAMRLERKQTRTQAAFHAGLSAATFAAMEGGHLKISDSALVKLSQAWGMSFEKLMRRVRG